jgi:hypothetical protein
MRICSLVNTLSLSFISYSWLRSPTGDDTTKAKSYSLHPSAILENVQLKCRSCLGCSSLGLECQPDPPLDGHVGGDLGHLDCTGIQNSAFQLLLWLIDPLTLEAKLESDSGARNVFWVDVAQGGEVENPLIILSAEPT